MPGGCGSPDGVALRALQLRDLAHHDGAQLHERLCRLRCRRLHHQGPSTWRACDSADSAMTAQLPSASE